MTLQATAKAHRGLARKTVGLWQEARLECDEKIGGVVARNSLEVVAIKPLGVVARKSLVIVENN